MRTTIHIMAILVVGVSLGLAVRAFRSAPAGSEAAARATSLSGQSAIADEDAAAGDEDQAPTRTEAPPPYVPAEGENWLTRFELTERSGQTVSSEQLKGQPYVVSFFFSTCPSVCVSQNQKLAELQQQFRDQPVRLVAISVDPENDTPEQLREYAARFGADPDQWLFLTGDLNYIRRVGSDMFQMGVDKQFHSEKFVLVDPNGKVEAYYSWTEPRQFQRLKQDIAAMIAAKQS